MNRLPWLLGVGGLTATAALLAPPAPPSCHLQVIPDYTVVVAYRAVLRPSPACVWNTVLRVRKSSTLNVIRDGAPYQPIKPERGAWEVASSVQPVTRPVPDQELWTLQRPPWRWEWFDETAMNAAGTPGRWRPAEVLRAAP